MRRGQGCPACGQAVPPGRKFTRDRLFGTSAGAALAALPELAIVVVTLPQAREEAYLTEFGTGWRRKRMEPIAGVVVGWP